MNVKPTNFSETAIRQKTIWEEIFGSCYQISPAIWQQLSQMSNHQVSELQHDSSQPVRWSCSSSFLCFAQFSVPNPILGMEIWESAKAPFGWFYSYVQPFNVASSSVLAGFKVVAKSFCNDRLLYLTLSIASTFKRPRPFCFVQMSCSTCSTCPTCSNTSWWSIGNNSNKI